MEEINKKIEELLALNAIEPDFTYKSTAENSFDAIMEKQEDLMEEIETLAKAKKTLIGRIMRFPMADSYALHIITKVSKSTATLQWIKWCDCHMDDRLGEKGTLPLNYATQRVRQIDALNALFSK